MTTEERLSFAVASLLAIQIASERYMRVQASAGTTYLMAVAALNAIARATTTEETT